MPASTPLPRHFFQRDPLRCAAELIGCGLVHGPCAGRIIETEAYREIGDEASHLFSRPSARAFAANHPPGTAYVYLNYGVHWLVNVLCRDAETGTLGFVLFRALEPLRGIERMRARRGGRTDRDLCSGPGKLTSALAIDGDHHGRDLCHASGLRLTGNPDAGTIELQHDRRVGISRARDLPWRVLAANHSGVSVPFGKVK